MNMDEVDELVQNWTSTRERDQVASQLSEAGVPVAVVRELDEVVRDPHLIHREFLQWIDHDALGEIPLPHSPIRFHGSPLRELEIFHGVGEDNEAIFGEFLGLSPQEVADRREQGII